MPNLLFSTTEGNVLDFPLLQTVGRTGRLLLDLTEEELIPLPEGATLAVLPGRVPVGRDGSRGRYTSLFRNPYQDTGEPVWAVGALLPQGYTRTYLPGYVTGKGAGSLPLLGYTAVAALDGQFYVAAIQTDEDFWWNPCHYNTVELDDLVKKKLAEFPDNRVLKQLARCSLEYGCFTAQNIFYGRWEGGIPVSPSCNARCVGCISLQESACCPAPQARINFRPTREEIVEIALSHLREADSPIISFGQGCEGEPALEAGLIGRAIREIRRQTSRGTINANTNAGFTAGIIELCRAGIDALRVSLNSANPHLYHVYYRPRNYSFSDVRESLKAAAAYGVYTSLNLLVFPGVTDREKEVFSLIKLIRETRVKQVQLRNLNIDPDVYLRLLPKPEGKILGIRRFIEILREELPEVALGNYSRPVKT
ncbi:radical SAM protein [Calderihabitans maritimus]|uniref:Radical SAM protein n=1 Tax=Calderihabitans maritimus TaxID=1246530 RepID=A0A1Z5HWA6_9FIRM|nr:radical SAM protein [Calderihabitans maritimus]GAW93794.1 radical SAM protein [Calderihabitans maritimus]